MLKCSIVDSSIKLLVIYLKKKIVTKRILPKQLQLKNKIIIINIIIIWCVINTIY